MAVHQGGKVCLISTYDAEQLKARDIVPRCIDHRHTTKAIAEAMVRDRLLQRVTVPGPERFVWIRPQHWKVVRGVMQLVEGDTPGRVGRLRYSIEAAGAHQRRPNIREINAEPIGRKR